MLVITIITTLKKIKIDISTTILFAKLIKILIFKKITIKMLILF